MQYNISKFIEGTYEMLERPDAKYLTWSKQGSSFIVIDQNKFAESMLLQYFHHNNFPSFLRQLNIYGFRKGKNCDGLQEFSHKFFRRGMKSLLHRVTKTKSQTESNVHLDLEDDTLRDIIESLVTTQKKLQHDFHVQVEKSIQLQQKIRWLKESLLAYKVKKDYRVGKLQDFLLSYADGLQSTPNIRNLIKSIIDRAFSDLDLGEFSTENLNHQLQLIDSPLPFYLKVFSNQFSKSNRVRVALTNYNIEYLIFFSNYSKSKIIINNKFMLNQDISELPVLKVSIPSFLLKMYEILEQPKFADIVSWNNDGSSFVVFNTHDLSSKVLANYFKHKNYPSFLRQLNMYNFKKTKNQNGQSEFRHKWFRRGLKSMLQYIRRRNQDESEVKVESRQNNYQLDQYKRDHETMKEQIQQLVAQSSEMHRTLEASLEQGASVRRMNSNLQQQFTNLETSNAKKFDTISMLLARIVSNSANLRMNFLDLENHLGEIFRITLTDDPRTLQDRQPRFLPNPDQLNYQLMNRESQYRPPIQNPYPWFNSSQPSAVDFSQFYQMQSPYSQPGRPPSGQLLALPPIPYSYQQSPLFSSYPSQPSSIGNSPYRTSNPVAHSQSTDTRSHDKYSFNQIT